MKHFDPRSLAGSTVLTRPGLVRVRTRDNLMTYDQAFRDSSGAFLNGELERMDMTLHMPLVDVTWGRDIDISENVSIGDEATSFTNSTFASAGGLNPTGKAWAGKRSNAITGIDLDIGKTASPLTLWAMELSWTLPELESAMKLGRPVDQQKYDGMNLKYQMDTDEQVYVGDSVLGFFGLVNSPSVTAGLAAVGAQGFTQWARKTPQEILADVNALLASTWAAAGYAVMPSRLLVPPVQFGLLVSTIIAIGGVAGGQSVLEYLRVNSLSNATNGRPLDIQPLKWLVGRGIGGTPGVLGTVDRIVAYSKDRNRVRFPMTLLQRTPVENRSLYQLTTYYGRLGVVEFVYPETLQYLDGI